MDFDIERVYTAVNAGELHIGDTVIVADDMETLRRFVEDDMGESKITRILTESFSYRFMVDNRPAGCSSLLAYLVMRKPEPEYIPWDYINCPLKCGDVVHYFNKDTGVQGDYMVTGVDNTDYLIIGRERVTYSNLLERYLFHENRCGVLSHNIALGDIK